MPRETFPLGSNSFVRNNGFSAEYLTSPYTFGTGDTNTSGAIGQESSMPIRVTQFAINFTNSSAGGVVRLRIANSSGGTDGYADSNTTTGTGQQRDYPNLAKFAGDTVYYGFSKGDTTTTEFFAGSGGIIYARRGGDASGRTLSGEFVVDTVPSAPRNLSAGVQSSSSVFLSWSAPSDNGGIPISGYRVLSQANNGSWSYATNVGSGTTQATISGLSPNTSYAFKVAAHNNVSAAHGGGVTSTSYHTGTNATSSTVQTPSDAQPATGQIEASSNSQSQVDISWSSSEGNAAPTSVTVRRLDNNSVISNSSSGSTSISGLSANTTYSYSIQVSNAQGGQTVTTSAQTLSNTPTLNISASAIDSTSARVIWNSSFATSVSVSGTGLNSSSQSGNEIITGLTPGGIYSWAGTASNADFSTNTTSNRIQLPNIIGGVWNGADWALPDVNVWNGSTWAPTETYVWTGSSWKFWA
jgi:hypothetical protein